MNVLLCDDHRLFLEALGLVVQAQGCRLVAAVTDPDQATAVISAERVDVCLMDLSFPNGSGVSGIEAIREISPRTKVIVLSGTYESDVLASAIGAGACGIVTKDEPLERIIDVMRRVHQGQTHIKADVLQRVLRTALHRATPERRLASFLTGREWEVLRALVLGKSTQAVARELGISSATVRTHTQRIIEKLGVHSKLEAVAFAVAHRLVPVEYANDEGQGVAASVS